MAGIRFWSRRRDRPRRQSSIAVTLWPFQYRTAFRVAQISDPTVQRQALVDILDNSGFNLRVFFVASSGFLTDSYNLFASNVILPSLAYVYLGTHDHSTTLIINALTLAGSACGQVTFGILADVFGRQRLYGVELVIVIFATLGLASSGPGFTLLPTGEHAMSPVGWIMFWRFAMGIGIGAEYPLSATITTEWASRTYRAQMMSAVFLMQPIGQFLAYCVGLAVLHGLSSPFGEYDLRNNGHNAPIGVDILWRIVAGVGGLPALLALIFRFTIPESPRYTCDIKQNSMQAVWDSAEGTTGLFEGWSRRGFDDDDGDAANVENGDAALEMEQLPETRDFAAGQTAPAGSRHTEVVATSDGVQIRNGNPEIRRIGQTVSPNVSNNEPASLAVANGHVHGLDSNQKKWTQFRRRDWNEYFHDGDNKGGNWRNLFGASIVWALLDFVFYGLGFNDPGTLARLWTAQRIDSDPRTPSWLLYSSAVNSNGSIFSVLNSNAIECLVTVSIWSLLGCALMTVRINFIHRRFTLIWTSLLLAVLLLITAIAFPYCFHQAGHPLLIVLYAAIQFWFSYGPNTLVFVQVAEIFPTRYRCTCYGIAAACGKTSAVLMQLTYLYFDNKKLKDPNSLSLGYILYLFAGFMLAAAIFAWIYIPDVQLSGSRKQAKTIIPSWWIENRTLEELAKGRANVDVADRVGFVERTAALRKRIRDSSRPRR